MDTKHIAIIEKLENDFDLVRSVVDELDEDLYNFAAVQRRIERLFQYQESGEWQKDFEADEKGELPKNMKHELGEKEHTLIFYPFSFNKKALKEFLSSDYGKAFASDDEEYEFTFKAGDPELNKLIVTLLEKYCGLTDKSKFVMKTIAEVFR